MGNLMKARPISESNPWDNPQEAQAALIRDQWDYAQSVYHPLENEAMAKVTSGVEEEANRAGAITQSAFTRSREQRRRDMSRYGTTESDRVAKSNARRDAIAESVGVADSENSMRRATEDYKLNAQAKLIGQGAGVASSANENLSNAANLQTQRQQTGENLKSQQKQRQIGGALSGAAIGFMAGGPVGAGVGALAGFFLG